MVEGVIRLSSGRHLAYFETGPPDAPALLYCHGTPGSRFELLLGRPALERNVVFIRLIALKRPGYGLSSFVSSQGFLPWASGVAEAADRLGLDRFAVLGASGGSPFTLACAHALADRIHRVALVAGVAPPDIPSMEQAAALADEYQKRVVRAIRNGPLSVAVEMGFRKLLVQRLIASLGPADRKALANPEATWSPRPTAYRFSGSSTPTTPTWERSWSSCGRSFAAHSDPTEGPLKQSPRVSSQVEPAAGELT